MVSIKLSLDGKKDYLLRAKWSYPEEWSYPSYMIRPSVLISLEESRLNPRKSMMTASIMYHGCHSHSLCSTLRSGYIFLTLGWEQNSSASSLAETVVREQFKSFWVLGLRFCVNCHYRSLFGQWRMNLTHVKLGKGLFLLSNKIKQIFFLVY